VGRARLMIPPRFECPTILTNAGTEGRIRYAGYFTTKHSLTSERPVKTAACSPRSDTDLSDQTRA